MNSLIKLFSIYIKCLLPQFKDNIKGNKSPLPWLNSFMCRKIASILMVFVTINFYETYTDGDPSENSL